ncbi:MAG: M20/M25/M40 family metallo-hydrolase, partial [Spirochaetales bacterium]|nr:M20/M25/M40 family metallo-hydrolase [Spirochaetales bacterium]
MQYADNDRLIQDFITLARIDAVSKNERAIADAVTEMLRNIGFTVTEDETASSIGGTAGNIYAVLHGNNPAARPVLFSAHLDTVQPGIGKQPLISENHQLITSKGSTIVGADDVCGIVEILEGIRLVLGLGGQHGDIEVLFTVAEENYGLGARHFDYSKLISCDVYVLDMSGSVGKAANAAPSIISFTAAIHGKASHAGFRPDGGINAVAAAADAISHIPQGRISETATFNIGTISGGTADNIVPAECRVTGECRSLNHDEALEIISHAEETFRNAAAKVGAELTFDSDVKIQAYRTPTDSDVCRDFVSACESLGLTGTIVQTLGGSDNNVFARCGLNGIVLSCGMFNTHSTEEYARIDDMAAGAELVAALIAQRAGSARRSEYDNE